MFFIIPDWVVYTVLVLVWAWVLWVYIIGPKYLPRIDAYFYKRRQFRKLRNYALRDVALTSMIYNTQPKKVNKRARARHRR